MALHSETAQVSRYRAGITWYHQMHPNAGILLSGTCRYCPAVWLVTHRTCISSWSGFTRKTPRVFGWSTNLTGISPSCGRSFSAEGKQDLVYPELCWASCIWLSKVSTACHTHRVLTEATQATGCPVSPHKHLAQVSQQLPCGLAAYRLLPSVSVQ